MRDHACILLCWALILAAPASPGLSESEGRKDILLHRCGDDVVERGGSPATYSGFYEAESESSTFKLARVPCEVWLTGDVCPIFGKSKCVKGARVKAYVTVEGVLSDPGNFGHFGMYERELRVTRVIKVRRIKD